MPKVLSVDDSGVMRRIIGRTVDVLGYGFLEAANGKEGLEVVAKNFRDIALIILDVNMPGMNGFVVCQALKSNPELRHIPVVMMTSIPTSAIVSKALACGAAEMLSKPFDLKQFQALVARNLAARPPAGDAPIPFPHEESGGVHALAIEAKAAGE